MIASIFLIISLLSLMVQISYWVMIIGGSIAIAGGKAVSDTKRLYVSLWPAMIFSVSTTIFVYLVFLK